MRGVQSRGWLYFTIGVLSVVGEKATAWISAPPENGWVYLAAGSGALTAGLIAVRAYMDQHISNMKAEGSMNAETKAATQSNQIPT